MSDTVNGESSSPWPRWGLKRREEVGKESPLPPNPTLVEVHEWVQPSHCHQHDNTLRPGHLLRWMDITACLSAENHAKFPCVTVSVDDISFDSTVSVGHVIILTSVVNRAFSSSLEVGIVVQSEDPMTGARQHVCNAHCVFVAKPKDGSKVKLSPVTLTTEKEHREHLLAAERRRMRITYVKDIQKILKGLQIAEEPNSLSITKGVIHVAETKVQTVHIVLPVHANHHGTTFGGQIMEWMTDIATISALRLCRCKLFLVGIESVHFRGPSYVGERVHIQTSVNRVFSNKKFEVGVRVEGYAVGGERRHINSAFYIFQAADDGIMLPKLLHDTQVEEERAANAVARHCLWLDRKAIEIQEHLVAMNSENIYSLILKNTSKLMTNFSLRDWETLPSSPEVEFCKRTVSENIFMRLSLVLNLDAEEVYHKLSDYKSRKKWDFICKNVRVVKEITKDDDLLHMAFNPVRQDELPKDFVLLSSRRTPLVNQANEDQQFYMLAFSSVLFNDVPPLADYTRSQVISSGYIIADIADPTSQGNKCCRLTYLHQLGSSVMPFFAKDMLGVSKLMEKLCLSMKKYLEAKS